MEAEGEALGTSYVRHIEEFLRAQAIAVGFLEKALMKAKILPPWKLPRMSPGLPRDVEVEWRKLRARDDGAGNQSDELTDSAGDASDTNQTVDALASQSYENGADSPPQSDKSTIKPARARSQDRLPCIR